MTAFLLAAGLSPFFGTAEAPLFLAFAVAPPPPPLLFSASGLSRSWLMKLPVRLFPLGRRLWESEATTGAGSSVGEVSCRASASSGEDPSDRRRDGLARCADGSGDPGACGGLFSCCFCFCCCCCCFDLDLPPRATVVVTGGSGTMPRAAAEAGLERIGAAA